jgi:hypothetical protein
MQPQEIRALMFLGFVLRVANFLTHFFFEPYIEVNMLSPREKTAIDAPKIKSFCFVSTTVIIDENRNFLQIHVQNGKKCFGGPKRGKFLLKMDTWSL